MSVEEQWDIPGLEKQLEAEFAISLPIQSWLDEDDKLHEEALREKIGLEVQASYDSKSEQVGPDMRKIEKQIMLQVLDTLWKEHLASMDQLRQGIHLRAYAQKNPKQEYKRESFELFEQLLENLKYEVVKFLSHVQIQNRDESELIEQSRREAAEREKMAFQHMDASGMPADAAGTGSVDQERADLPQTYTREERKVGRNEPCPCGSGKKYKQCHGVL